MPDSDASGRGSNRCSDRCLSRIRSSVPFARYWHLASTCSSCCRPAHLLRSEWQRILHRSRIGPGIIGRNHDLGVTISGNNDTGRKVTETAPAITVTSEITIATIGRLMKNLAILRGSRVGVSAYRRVGVSRFAKRDHSGFSGFSGFSGVFIASSYPFLALSEINLPFPAVDRPTR